MQRLTIHPRAPQNIGGYRVIAATAGPTGNTRNGDGSPAYYAGVARIVREDGKQAVVWYDEDHAQVYGRSCSANLYATKGVNDVARWVSAATARSIYREMTWHLEP